LRSRKFGPIFLTLLNKLHITGGCHRDSSSFGNDLANQGRVSRTSISHVLSSATGRTAPWARRTRSPGQGHMWSMLGHISLPWLRRVNSRASRCLGRTQRSRTTPAHQGVV